MTTDTSQHVNRGHLIYISLVVVLSGFITQVVTRSLSALPTAQGVILATLMFVACAAFWRVRNQDLHVAYIWLYRGLALVLTFYVVSAVPGFDAVSHSEHAELIRLRDFLPWVAVVAAAISMVRPVFAIVPAGCVIASKSVSEVVHGLPSLSQTDYLPLVELSIFLGVGLIVAHLAERISRLSIGGFITPLKKPDVGKMLFLSALAVHFGNYFYSGLTKLSMDGGTFDWILNSPTQYMTEAAGVLGGLPLAVWPEFVGPLHYAFGEWVVVSNLVVLATQVGALIAVIRVRAALILTIWFDITHMAIFLLTGILFWKWILLNALFVVGLMKMAKERLETWQRWFLLALVPAANVFFLATTLAWYDSPGLLHHRLVAVTDEGQRARVPSNFFLDASVTVAQNRLGTPEGHFPTSTWGGTQHKAIQLGALDGCQFASQPVVRPMDEYRLRSFVTRYHRYVQRNLNEYGQFAFDLYPHHIFSNPSQHTEFYALDLRKVTKYEYVVESVCLDGKYSAEGDRIAKRDVIEIDI